MSNKKNSPTSPIPPISSQTPSNQATRSSIKEKIKLDTKKTLKGSSIHAIPNIVRSKYYSLKVIFFLCFLASSSLCAWYLITAIQNYLKYETVTNIKINEH